MKEAKFTYYGRTPETNKLVSLYKRGGRWICAMEGYPSLTRSHPSFEVARRAFADWYELAQKDFGASDIDWGDVESQEVTKVP